MTLKPAARNILIIKHGAFGDVMQSEGALRDIRENYPDARLTVLTTPPYAKIFRRCPVIDEVRIDPRDPRWRLDRMWRLRTDLRSAQFDFVIDLQNSARTAFYYRWFLRDLPWSGTAPGCSHPHRADNPKAIHSLQRLAGQLTDAGLIVRHTLSPDLRWMANDVSHLLAEASVSGSYIVLIPGSSARHPQKRWPYYLQLAQALWAEGETIVTAPGPDEMALCRSLPAIMLTGGRFLDWFDLAGVLAGAKYVVGNDTGPTHLAAHLGTPGLALFGSHTTAERTGIVRDRFGVIEVPDLAALSPQTVLERVRADLKDQSNSV